MAVDERLRVSVPGGAEIAYVIAGVGARSYAFLIDWHIRLLVALGWLLLVWLLAGGWGADTGLWSTDLMVWGGLVPAGVVYLLYHPLVEVAMKGRSPGKRYAGVRVLAADGSVPGAGALLTRNVFRLVDSLPMFYGFGLVAAAFTRQQVRIGDLAARTVLVYDDRADQAKLGELLSEDHSGTLSRPQRELLHDLLQRWSSLTAQSQLHLGKRFLAHIGEAPPQQPSEAGLRDAIHQRLRSLYEGHG